MPRIPTFDAGEGKLQPSEAGSAAFREAGAVTQRNAARVGAMIEQTGASISGGLKAFGGAISKMEADAKDREDKAQDHTDAMAQIEFQNQLTSSQIAAMGGINKAGTPTAADGTPIEDHPGRGGASLPPDANVPSVGSYAVGASDAINGHRQFADNLLTNIPEGVSQKARDHMALQAAKANGQIQIHAAAVANEVALARATHATEGSINDTLGALEGGTMTLPIALDKINSSLDSFQKSLTGDYAAAGAKIIEKKRTDATELAIRTSVKSDLLKGDTESALRTINDPQWNSIIGGKRDEMRTDVANFQAAQVKQQEQQRKFKMEQQKDAALSRTDQYVKDAMSENPQMKVEDIWTDKTYDDRPDLKKEAIGVFETMHSMQNKELNISPALSMSTKFDLFERMSLPEGDPRKISDRRAVDQAFINKTLNQKDFDWLQTKLKSVEAPAEKRLHEFEESSKDYFNKDLGLSMGPLQGELSPSMARYQYLDALHNKISEYKSTPGKDWTDLINPGKPDYMGGTDTLDKYKKPLTQTIGDKAAGSPLPAGAPGSTRDNAIPVPKGATQDDIMKDPKTYPPGSWIMRSGKSIQVPGKRSETESPFTTAMLDIINKNSNQDLGLNKISGDVVGRARDLVFQGGPEAVKEFINSQGFQKSSAWCGEFAAAVVKSEGGTPPKNPEVASNWRTWGQASGNPQRGDVAVRKSSRFGGGYTPTGATGSHVTFVDQTNPQSGTFRSIGGNQGGAQTYRLSDFEFRHAIRENMAAR